MCEITLLTRDSVKYFTLLPSPRHTILWYIYCTAAILRDDTPYYCCRACLRMFGDDISRYDSFPTPRCCSCCSLASSVPTVSLNRRGIFVPIFNRKDPYLKGTEWCIHDDEPARPLFCFRRQIRRSCTNISITSSPYATNFGNYVSDSRPGVSFGHVIPPLSALSMVFLRFFLLINIGGIFRAAS